MKPNVAGGRRVAGALCVVCLGLLHVASLSAQEPKLRVSPKGHTGAIVAVAFSPNGKTVVTASHDGRLKLWDTATGKERATFGEYRGCLGCVAFSSDGKILASGAIGSPAYFPELEQVKLWDAATGKVLGALEGHEGSVFSAAFSPDSKTLASVSEDETVRLWNMATGKELAAFPRHSEADEKASGPIHSVMSVAFSPNGKTLAAASNDMTIKVWDLATHKRSTFQGHTHSVYSVAFSSDGETLASASGDKTVRLWRLATGRQQAVLKGHTDVVLSVAFSPNDKILASAGVDKTIRLWDTATGRELGVLQGAEAVRSVAFSPDGKTLASAGGTVSNAPGELKLWDMSARE